MTTLAPPPLDDTASYHPAGHRSRGEGREMTSRVSVFVAALAALTLSGCGDFIVREDARRECNEEVRAAHDLARDAQATARECVAHLSECLDEAPTQVVYCYAHEQGSFECEPAVTVFPPHSPARSGAQGEGG